ncbi:MAG: hypothetical protein NC085_08325, partial [Muribaculaceae bacterium]|nr:hypothetical protein [Muribaculaceae bacterium]
MNKIRIAIVFIVLAIIGFSLTIGGISDIIKLNGDLAIFNIDDMREAKKGDIAYGIVWNVYENYANETTTNTTMGIETSSYTSREYFVMGVFPNDSEEEYYLTLSASKKDDIAMIYDIITYEMTSEDWEDHPEFPIYVKVKALDSDLNGFLTEELEAAEIFDSRDELQSHIVQFELAVYDPQTAYTNLIIGIVIIAVVAVVGFFVVRRFLPQKNADVPFTPPADNGGNAAANGFSETYAAPQPLPNVSQPANPDDFFPARKPKSEPKPETKPAPKKVPPKPAPQTNFEDTNLDTSGLDAEQDLYRQEQALAANARPVEYDNKLETADLDTEQQLAEQERKIAANVRPVDYDNQLETSGLDAEQRLYEQEQALAANVRPAEYDNQLETSDLDTDSRLEEQERKIAANTRKIEYDNEIDTSGLDTDSLENYNVSEQGEDDDIFIFS